MSIESDDGIFVSKLDERGREIARTELHELNDKDRELAVQTLRQWVLEQTWLKTPTDFEFLLRFLRVRKFSQLEARKSLENYWTSKTSHPEWFKDVDPADDGIIAMIKSGFILCPKKYDKLGRRIFIGPVGCIKAELIDKYGVDILYRTICCVLDWVATDENVQVHGLASLYDYTNPSFTTFTKTWTPSAVKNYMHFFQKAVPIRYKTIAIYNESTIFDLTLAIAKPFMTDKMKERIKMYGKTMVKLHEDWGIESFSQEYLPDEYTGPSIGNTASIIDEMLKEMLDPKFRSYMKDLSSGKYGVDTTIRKQDTETEVASFRKLNIE